VNLGVKRAFFYVLINTEMPSILAEVGFISNPEEERLLKKESYRQKIAEALFEGVKKYVEGRSPQVAGI
jgi:N-acetylmuramoyl-L-alanine amidase